ncbi:MAG TPA: hypothetical protein VGP88_08035, partial [Thermoplasmata archaeon]|nr:hypothetical protein [Thermoplasmata archaeon]
DINFTGAYKVTLLGSTGGTVSAPGGSGWVASGALQSVTARPSSGYSFGGWSGTGPGSYTGPNLTATVRPTGPIVEAASFVPMPLDRFNLTVNETGLPTGTNWTVFVNGSGYSTNVSTLVIPHLYSCALSGSVGNYPVYFPAVASSTGTEYAPLPTTPTTACVTRIFNVTFAAAYAVTVSATAGGVVTGATPGVPTWIAVGDSLVLSERTNSGYLFLGWTGSGPGSITSAASTITVAPTGAVTELAAWAVRPAAVTPTYSVTFQPSSALPTGTAWSVLFDGVAYASASGPLVVTGVANGTHTYSVPDVGGAASGVRYVPAPTASTVVVTGANVPVPVPFTAEYWVAVSSVGAGTVGPTSGWVVAGTTVLLNATPLGGSIFEGWSGSGNGSYSGSDQGPSIRALGPVSEQATFVSAPSSTTTSGSSSPSTLEIAGLAVVGLVVGVVVGLLVGRRGRPPTGQAEPDEPSASSGGSEP